MADQSTTRWTRNAADEYAVAQGCRFDERRAEHVVEFFRKFLRHTKGEWEGRPFELVDWQRDQLIKPLFGWVNEEGHRRFNTAVTLIPKKNGKPLALDTPIPTPTGWTTMGEIRPGDTVFDEHGAPARVVAATEYQHHQPCYRLTFSDGTSVVAAEGHEWLTRTRKPEGATRVWTTREIAETLRIEAPGSEGSNHAIPYPPAILCCADAELPVEPYTLGVWLGDGNSTSNHWTCGQHDADEMVSLVTASGTAVRKSNAKCGTRYVLGPSPRRGWQAGSLLPKLRQLNLLKNKHIPRSYLRASVSQRTALLQGLMDTDGYVSKAGQCEFTTTKESLRDGFLELARSLGYKPLLTTGRAMLDGRDCGPKYRIKFCATKERPCFRLARKISRLKDSAARSLTRMIVSVDPVPSVPVRCIQVDSASHLYLCGPGMIPTHNSTMASGVGLYLLAGDGEPGNEVYSVATKRDQAAIVHREAINMVEKSPSLKRACPINRSTWRISYENSFYAAWSSEAGGAEGLNGSVIADEIHAWKGRTFYNALKWAGAARRNPLFFIISTFGDESDSEALWVDLRNYAEGVNSGTIQDERFFGLVYETPPLADWTDVETAKVANPGLGNILSVKKYEADLLEAKNTPSLQSAFRRYRLNQRVAGGTPWLPWEAWCACGREYTLETLRGRECVASLDLSVSWDMSALVLVFQDEQDEDGDYPIWLWPVFYLPEETIARPNGPESFRAWQREGHLIATPGSTIDYGYLERSVVACSGVCPVFELTFDPAQAEKTTTDLSEAMGIERFAYPQNYAQFAEPTAEFERLILRGKLRHPNHPILSWQAQHVQIKQDHNGHSRPVKPKKGDVRKIDGIVASVMGLGRQMTPENRARTGGGQLLVELL